MTASTAHSPIVKQSSRISSRLRKIEKLKAEAKVRRGKHQEVRPVQERLVQLVAQHLRYEVRQERKLGQ